MFLVDPVHMEVMSRPKDCVRSSRKCFGSRTGPIPGEERREEASQERTERRGWETEKEDGDVLMTILGHTGHLLYFNQLYLM